MEVFGDLAGGFATALHPINMAMLFVAVVLGLVIGVLPGLGGTSGVAILLPITVFIAHGSLPGSDATWKSVAMLALGLLLAAVGFDTITGEQRLNFGQVSLLSGIGFVPVTIGLFGIGEILASAEEQGIGFVENIPARLGLTDVFEALRELRKRLRLVLSNAIIGFFFGVLPGHGATAASFLGYGLARQYSSNKENFGKGEI